MSNILVIDDETRITAFVARGLRSAGYACTVEFDGESGLAEAQTGAYDLVLLDIGLPSLDGFEILRRIRVTHPTLPVIMLTARGSVEDTVLALDEGANDYLAKPFRLDELLARIRLRLREKPASAPTDLRHGALSLDLRTRRATLGDLTVDLSAREFALLEEFLRSPEQVLSREQLLSRVWGYDFDPGSNVLDVYIRYLRNKLGPESIETVRGMGYRLR